MASRCSLLLRTIDPSTTTRCTRSVWRARGRPIENKWIGQRITDPDIDIAALARAQGAMGLGPIDRGEDLVATLRAAIAAVDAGGVAVVDVRIEPGYAAAMAAATVRSAD